MMADLTTKYMEDADLGLGWGVQGWLGLGGKRRLDRYGGSTVVVTNPQTAEPSNRQTVELYCSTTIKYLLGSQNLSGAAIAISPFNCPFFGLPGFR